MPNFPTPTGTVCDAAADTAGVSLSSLSRSFFALSLSHYRPQSLSHSRHTSTYSGALRDSAYVRLTRRSEGVLEHVVGDHVQLLLLFPLDVHRTSVPLLVAPKVTSHEVIVKDHINITSTHVVLSRGQQQKTSRKFENWCILRTRDQRDTAHATERAKQDAIGKKTTTNIHHAGWKGKDHLVFIFISSRSLQFRQE